MVERLRDRYGDDFEDAVPEGTAVVWGVGAARKNAVNDQWQAEHPDGGWKTITPDAAAQWAVAVADSWMTLLTDDPPTVIFQAGPPASPPPQIVTTTRVQVVEPSETPSTAGDLPS